MDGIIVVEVGLGMIVPVFTVVEAAAARVLGMDAAKGTDADAGCACDGCAWVCRGCGCGCT